MFFSRQPALDDASAWCALLPHGSISFLPVGLARSLTWLNNPPPLFSSTLLTSTTTFPTSDRATCTTRQRLPSPPIAPPTRAATPPPALGAAPLSTPPPTRRGWRKEGLVKPRPALRAKRSSMTMMGLRRGPGSGPCRCRGRCLGRYRRLDDAGQAWR